MIVPLSSGKMEVLDRDLVLYFAKDKTKGTKWKLTEVPYGPDDKALWVPYTGAGLCKNCTKRKRHCCASHKTGHEDIAAGMAKMNDAFDGQFA